MAGKKPSKGEAEQSPRDAEVDPKVARLLAQIRVWRDELINLARSNRLLYFKHTRASTLEIVRSPGPAAVVSGLLAGHSWAFLATPEPGQEIAELRPDQLGTNKDAVALDRALRALDRRATEEYMEKGLWTLYLAAGILRWTDPDTDETIESPILLVPASLARENPRDPFLLKRADEEPVINPALVVKLAEFGITLPALDDIEELDVSAIFTAVEHAVHDQDGWTIEPRLIMSPFSFHKAVMYKDLLDHEEAVASHELIGALVHGAESGSALDFQPVPEDRLDRDVPPEQVATILDADATQRQCIDAAARGNSFVMDGPPGTGKSQTIANIIAELLHRGRTVLFVSEKAAALEVVAKRLQSAGLGDYALELHSHKATRREVAQELGRALTRHPAARPELSAADLARLRQRREELSERAHALNELRPEMGRSLHEVIGRISQLESVPQAPPPDGIGANLSAADLTQILAVSDVLARSWGPVIRGDDFLWRDLLDVRMDARRRYRVAEQMSEASEARQAVEVTVADVCDAIGWPSTSTFAEAEVLLRVLAHLQSRPDVPDQWLTTDENLNAAVSLVRTRRESAERRAALVAALEAVLPGTWNQLAVTDPDIGQRALELLAAPPVRWDASGLPLGSLAALLSFRAQTLDLAGTVGGLASTVASAFGLRADGVGLKRARELGELAEIAERPQRPEPYWINPAVVESVQLATDVLRPLIESFCHRRESLGEVFTDDVLDLDLESLCVRFEQVHRGWKKLGGAYRADKRTVASVTRTKKADKVVLGRLREALDWQALSRQLESAETAHAAALGARYRRREGSDFDAIVESLASLRRALAIAGSDLNIAAMQRELANGGSPDAAAHSAAAQLRLAIDAWSIGIPAALEPLAAIVREVPLDALADYLESVAGPTDNVARALEPIVRARPEGTLQDGCQALDSRREIAAVEQVFALEHSADEGLIGAAYGGLETDWSALADAIVWATEARRLIARPLSQGAVARLVGAKLDPTSLESGLQRFARIRSEIASNFTDPQARALSSDLNTTFEEARDLVQRLSDTVADVDEWVEYSTACGALTALGISEPLQFAIQQRIPASDLSSVIERAVLEKYLDTLIESERGRFGSFRSDQMDSVLDEFRRLDRALVDHAASAVITECNSRRPTTTLGAAGVIQREAAKQRRHMPVRELLQQAGEVAQALKPCFMMSPLTVSQFLPTAMTFDTVIFDEASQVRPSDAINCIYRGRHLVVAGDDKQLPPTSFFERVGVDGDDDDWDEGQFDEFESILSLCKGSGGMRDLPLRWHYRSQHEALITYSNYAFYAPDGHPLITFPGAVQESPDVGVALYHVPDGIYRRGGARDNPVEAQRVADRVMEWARRSAATPGASVTVGVVAFSEAQATAIEAAIEQRRQNAPEFDDFFSSDRLDGFFVKNLENVQGDERDVMIFSIGYGRDEIGRFTLNFGPLNRSGGQRRLNVAITRARRRIEIVSSVNAGDFPAEVTSPGIQHLRRYLDFAERGPAALALEIGSGDLDAESPFEETVLGVLRSWGYDAVPQVGVAGYRVDIGVRHPAHPGHFAIGVECDGAMYHSSKVARDRDRLRQEVLERLGWRLHRIWGTSWYRDRKRQEVRLRAAVEAAIDMEASAPLTGRAVVPPVLGEPEVKEVELNAWPEWACPYVPAKPRAPRLSWLEMHDPLARSDLRRMVSEVVIAEGPVADEVVLRRIREAWGVGRAGSRIRDAFAEVVGTLLTQGALHRVEGRFLASDNAPMIAARVPFNDENAARPVDQVPGGELDVAVEGFARQALRVSEEELTRQVAWLFGWNRRGPEIQRALLDSVERLVDQGRLSERDGEIVVPRD